MYTLAYPIQLVVETTGIAHWVSIVIPPPQYSLGGLAVTTLIVHALQVGFLVKVMKVCVYGQQTEWHAQKPVPMDNRHVGAARIQRGS